MCHFFICGISSGECTAVFSNIEGQRAEICFSIKKKQKTQASEPTVCTVRRIKLSVHTSCIVNTERTAAASEPHSFQVEAKTDWFCPNRSGTMRSRLHMSRHWHKLAQARGWCPVGEAAVSLWIYSWLWEFAHTRGTRGA